MADTKLDEITEMRQQIMILQNPRNNLISNQFMEIKPESVEARLRSGIYFMQM